MSPGITQHSGRFVCQRCNCCFDHTDEDGHVCFDFVPIGDVVPIITDAHDIVLDEINQATFREIYGSPGMLGAVEALFSLDDSFGIFRALRRK